MGLASEMKSLSEELLASFKQRIRENEELVNDVQQTLDNFRKDHQEMAAALNANAADLRKGLATGEKERINTYHALMTDIHQTIGTIQQEVADIQAATLGMISEFTVERGQMAGDLDKFFAQGRADRARNEKTRMSDFNTLMKEINLDIKNINAEVLSIFKNTNDMLDRFEKEHLDMSAELRAELNKNLAERVEYTRTLLNGFQKRLSEISKENQKMAQKLRKDLASGETERLSDYNGIMKGIHVSIKGIRKEVRDIEKATNNMIDDLTTDRAQAAASWGKMQAAMDQIRETGKVPAAKQPAKKAEKKEVKQAPAVEVALSAPEGIKPVAEAKPVAPMTLEQKVLDYINKHPKGVKISEMEEPLGETRMKLGFTAKALLDEGKVQKIDNIYFPKLA
ncbi:MAG: hypothetical protein WCO44_10865 [Bacteroidota bacterium]